MRVANIYEAKTHFSKLIEEVLRGEDVVIARAGKPLIRLVAYQPRQGKRHPGAWKGRITIAKDFDQLPTKLARAFRGEEP